MEQLKYILFLTLGLFFFFSCTILKHKKDKRLKTEAKTVSTETGQILSKRKGDTLTYFVPNI